MIKVQCRCGAVKVDITGEPIVQFFCHCDDCQAVHGGCPARRNPSYPADAVKVGARRPHGLETRSATPASPAPNAARGCLSMSKRGACEASMDTCCRRANSNPRFMCNASSPSGLSSMTFHIIRACRSFSEAQTTPLDGRFEEELSRRLLSDKTDRRRSTRRRASQNLYPIQPRPGSGRG